eukprot:gb/GECH01010828.1/.p1 GENE.gb/GECH01010828.1/~~gb/GECH01010828.1/.p1  ORF type:complete len:469 (+),score=121.14 gb/GECH01010828.1/:1-1407(+)
MSDTEKKDQKEEHLDLREGEEEFLLEADSENQSYQQPIKKSLNIVFIGHVDAGKSTISGHLMYLTGQVDQRTLDKYEREAKTKNRESWKYAWVIDVNEEEREKGKTVECGQAYFETKSKRFVILDAPGHSGFVSHMIGGASQADIGVLVVSARRGEFETGFDKGGQTREHAILAKTAGVRQLVVFINKMDEETVAWDEERYKEIKKKITPFLKGVGFNPKTDLYFLPGSGLTGKGLTDRIPEEECSWYQGKCLLETLEDMPPPARLLDSPVRLPITDRYKEKGVVIHGKLESGVIKTNDKLTIMPSRKTAEITNISIDNNTIETAQPGDNLRLRVKGVDEGDVNIGFVLCDREKPVPAVKSFVAQVKLLDYKSIICPGFKAIMHIHALQTECTFDSLLATLDRKTQKIDKKKPRCVKSGDTVLVRIKTELPVCLETYKSFDRLGRFMIRDEGKTVGIGIISKLHEESK